MKISKGTILEFEGDTFTDLAYLMIDNCDGDIIEVGICSFTELKKAFSDRFKGFLLENGKIDKSAVLHKEVFYLIENQHYLTGISSVETASFELLAAYGYYKGKDVDEGLRLLLESKDNGDISDKGASMN